MARTNYQREWRQKQKKSSSICTISTCFKSLFFGLAILVIFCTFQTLQNVNRQRAELLLVAEEIDDTFPEENGHRKENVVRDKLIDSSSGKAVMPSTDQEKGLEERADPAKLLASLPSSPLHANDIHVVFSTDCGGYQNWQAEVFFHSAQLVNHTAPITRIASGCSEEEQQKISEHHSRYLSSQFKVHFTPDFSWDEKRQKRYPYYNKPHGILHWLENVPSPEAIVALADPDMMFLEPLTPFIDASRVLVSGAVKKNNVDGPVEEGRPAGQTYGFGGQWTRLDRARICGPGSTCATIRADAAATYYAVGPPYIAHKRDWMKIAKSWVEFVPQTFDQLPSLMAEMYAWCLAAAHHDLPHRRLDHYMVSNVGSPGEGWDFINAMEDVCDVPSKPLDRKMGNQRQEQQLPTFLHYCQRYIARDFLFAKRRFPKNFFTCEHPYFTMPSKDLQEADWGVKPAETGSGLVEFKLSRQQARQNAFMVCTALRIVNSALRRYKGVACGAHGGSDEVVQFSFENFK